ncbi:hypothetical protein OJF2_67320 [Aquisphaera giovannonii]|uniref:Sulfatase n=1 Tax=Aquisphaera giovannonii TaxID=406548 RepID=A0A5B9WCX9_9BACT|nr:DUF1501 domain-containing protein [Aquisphaera giovannonii]QEH38134.1 hypothetical protein OJF2_67320 [Aquisphaera giovannonii]
MTGPLNPPVTRRQAIARIGGGFGALGLAGAFAQAGLLGGVARGAEQVVPPNPLAARPPHFPARAKRVIFLFMNGGPSHIDTFDPKPKLRQYAGKDAPESMTKTNRKKKGAIMPSPFAFARRGQSGIEVSELFPEVASCIDDLCVIRSLYTDNPNHEPSLLMMNSGNMQPIRPSLGSWLTFGLGSENQNLPGFVVLCPGKPVVGPQLWSNSFLPGVFQGTHINNKTVDPERIIRDIRNRHLSPAAQREQVDLLQRLNQAHLEARGRDEPLEARIASLEIAYRMQFEARDAFDVGRESPATRALYGDGEFANACLIARRLAERGVRVTQVYYGNDQPWDDHSDILNHRNHARKSDRAVAALLRDLKSRGLLDETLVIWGGEFGRTPTSEGAKGRDHHSTGFTMWLAGGGVRGGMVHGATDELGFHAVTNRMHVHDLHATILHLMGLDHERLTFRYSGRDFRLTDVHGSVATEILA